MSDSDIIEISTLDLNDTSDSIFINSSKKSTNFGSGIELLMNDKLKESGGSLKSDIELEDLNNLENELNNLSSSTSNSYNLKSDLFTQPEGEKHSVKFSDDLNSIGVGKSTAETDANSSKTWDGYGKFNNIPLNPDKSQPSQPQMSKEELLREKFKYLRKLEALEKKGIEIRFKTQK
jgi:hypothetical protein